MERALRLAPYVTILIAAIACLPSLTVPIGFFSEGDALDYRVPILKWMLRHHAYPNWGWTFVDDYPMLGELLMLPFFAVKDSLARIVAIAGYFGVCAFGGLIAGELVPNHRRRVALFCFAGLLGFQPLLVQSCLVLVDNVGACFTLGSLYFLLRGRLKPAGAMLALALATRYTTWSAAPGGLAALLILRRGRPGLARDCAVYLGIGFLGAAPFLARNWAVNGNPFYPILDEHFHGIPFGMNDAWKRSGLWNLLRFPYDLFYTHTFVNEIFDTRTMPEGYYSYRLGFLTYLQLAGAVLGLAISRRLPRVSREAAAVLAFAVALFGFWWWGGPVLRYFGAGLALFDAALLALVATRAPRAARLALVLLPLAPIFLVQRESWNIAFGRAQSFRDTAYVASAAKCFQRAGVPPGAVMGFSSRDSLNAYFDYDFVFVPPNNLYRLLPGVAAPRPDFIYSGIEVSKASGYEDWPAGKPCLLRRIETAHQADHDEKPEEHREARGRAEG